MKRIDDKGITLISLVTTIVILVILASIATYSGIGVIKQTQFTKFSTQLKMMQTQVNELYDKYGDCGIDINTEQLVLYRYDVLLRNSNSILLDKAIYNGSKKFCIVYNKTIADKLIKYKNLITNIDGLFYGELNGIKKS